MSSSQADGIRRERLEADARYNHALTELDRAIVEASGRPLAREDFDRLSTALIVFLQQITGFVESSDRQVVQDVEARMERLERGLASTDELKAQVSIMQRAVQALRRGIGSSPQDAHHQPSARDQSTAGTRSTIGNQSAISNLQSAFSDSIYLAFEDAFRGSDDSVHGRVREYVPVFRGTTNVVDLGCGRGEFLAALKTAGIEARGVDPNREMVAVARERGLDVVPDDALGYLLRAADESIGGLIAIQVIEHLEPSYLVRLLDAASRKMRPGAPIVLETINPACWLAFFSSYLRDFTHVRPVHPETLQYLLRASGFERVALRYSAPVPDHVKMQTIDLPGDVLQTSEPCAAALVRVAHTINANAAILNNLMFTHMDYAAVAYR